ncbi:MAG: rane protein involved in aromatic hydrocarbon degradation [Bacteroidota bacterium]|nr:rane protein involved in aromatic hydrocarbon degradation [Bacteroidota bacterium]
MKAKILIAFLLFAEISFAQYYPDESILLARSAISGSARTAGSGGAYGSVGADLGSVGINPAGLGLYRSSDFCVTPGIKISNNETVYDGSHAVATSPKFYLGQAGVEWTKILSKATDKNEVGFGNHALRSITFAINFQAESFYARSQNFGAENMTHSMIDNYTEYMNSTLQPISSYPLEPQLANAVGLIGYDSIHGNYYSNVRAPVQQAGSIETRGYKNKIDLGFGGNINDKIYFGVALCIPLIDYNTVTTFSETNPNGSDSITHFQSYTLISNYHVTGAGFSGIVGLIYRPLPWMRFGAAYHLPTWYSLTDYAGGSITAYYDTVGYQIPQQNYDPLKYSLRSPMKGVISASFYYKQNGFFSIDYEFQNLASSRFNFGSQYADGTKQMNDTIKADYGYLHTIRAGFEGSYKALRLRAGYSFSSSPYKKGVAMQGDPEMIQNVTAGIGVRLKHFYADMAYVFGMTKDISYPQASDPVNNTYLTHTLLITLGWKFGGAENGTAETKKKRYSPPPPPDNGTDRY